MRTMNKRIIIFMAAALALLSAVGQVTFTGWELGREPFEVSSNPTTDLYHKIYILYDTQGVGMSFTSSNGQRATWTCFGQDNWANPDTLSTNWDGISTTSIDQVEKNKGYKIEDGTTTFYCWVVNYADYYLELNNMSINDENPCDPFIVVDGYGPAIPYYVNGHPKHLSRDIKLKYNTLVWDENASDWDLRDDFEQTLEDFSQRIDFDEPPLCDFTDFELVGDRFLKKWGIPISVKYENFETQVVASKAFVEKIGQENEDDEDNEDGSSSSSTEFDGSAPINLRFIGKPAGAAEYKEWEMATDFDFENVILRYYQDEVEYSFTDVGTYYMRYTVTNRDRACPVYSDIITIRVADSKIGVGEANTIPNVFSPGEEVNNVWKVPHKSIAEFHCWIYNRWGNLVYEFTDPDGGWDGYYHGRIVDTGVYFYVIKARGYDGKKFTRRGDISILRYKGTKGTSADN